MKAWIGVGMLVALSVGGTIAASAEESKSATAQSAAAVPGADNMTAYRNLAADTLKAFNQKDMATAKKKAKELETAWDNREKALKKSSPDVWGQIDKSMDDFIKPAQNKSSDAAKVQAAYDAFIAKLQLAVK